jgi:hypothetical protein
MTLSTTTARIDYAGDGTTTAFAVPFQFFGADELEVIERSAAGAETVRTLGTNYSVAGGAGATGTVTAVVAPATGVTWVIRRKTLRTQPLVLTPEGGLPAKSIEARFDRQVAMAQEQDEVLARALRFPRSDPAGLTQDLPTSVQRAGKMAGYDSSGNPTAIVVTAGTATYFAQWGGTAAGTANARTLAPAPAVSAYAAGLSLVFVNGAAANTGATTLAVSGLSALAVLRPDGSALTGGEMPSGALLSVVHDGAAFRLANLVISAAASETASGIAELATQAETNTGTDDLRIVTPLKVARRRVALLAQASGYTAVAADHGRVIEATGTWTLLLTAAATLGDGYEVRVENVGSGLITVDPSGAETVDGQTTIVVPPRFGATLRCTGTAWRTRDFPDEVVILGQTTPGGTGLVDFTLPSPDLLYRLRFTNLTPANAELLLLRWSTDGGATFLAGASDYFRAGTYNGAATATGFGDLGGTAITLTTTVPAGNPINGVCEFHPGAASILANVYFAQAGLLETTSTYYRAMNTVGRRAAAGAVNAVRLLVATGNFNSGGRVTLIGLRP